jgi:hypothetical protein
MSESSTQHYTGQIAISQVTSALLQALKAIRPKSKPDEYSKITVSRAVSFFALAYERVRNVIEYRDDHLVRRAAIERIAKRRVSLNPHGKGEGENIVRELLWARYFPADSLSEMDIVAVQKILDTYLSIRRDLVTGREGETASYLNEFLFDLMTCEIEEYLSPESSQRENIFTYFIFQCLKDKIKIEDVHEDVQHAYLLAALEKTYRKSDTPYQRYHLFTIFYQPLATYDTASLADIVHHMPKIFRKIDDTLGNSNLEKLSRFVKKQLPSYLILFELIQSKSSGEIKDILESKEKLWSEVELLCRQKYSQTGGRLRTLGIRSIIYILITKMLLAIAMEGPLSQLVYNEIHWESIIINSVFPVLLMAGIIFTTSLPGEENTKRIFQRIVEIIDADPQYEQKVVLIAQKTPQRKPHLQIGFTLLYVLAFGVTLWLIFSILDELSFNLISKSIFIFFVSTVAFFAQRIRQVASEYRLIDKDTIFTPFVDFFFMPILSLGKFFSSGMAKLNFFTFIFDVLIEAPYKLIIEVIEEWIKFTRTKKEEII